MCYCFREHLPCCAFGWGTKQKDEEHTGYHAFGGVNPFYMPQNYFCNNGNGDGETPSAYGCVAAPMGQNINASVPTTMGGLAKPTSGKKGKVNPLNL